jgi:tetratricopeptide (TPR) repeat protein
MDERVKQLLAIGLEHYEAREFVPAEPYLRQVVEALPNYADLQNMLGVTFFQQGKFDLARDAFERAVKNNPGYSEAALNLAVTYNELGRYSEGRKIHEQMCATCSEDGSLDPYVKGKIANMHAEIAAAYEDYQMYAEAIRELREALRLCPNFADLRTQLGNILRDSGDIEAALSEFSRAKQDNPRYVPARVNLGMALFIRGRRDEAIKEWEESLEIDPENRLARTSLRMVLARPKPAASVVHATSTDVATSDEQSIMAKLDAALDQIDSENFGRDQDEES